MAIICASVSPVLHLQRGDVHVRIIFSGKNLDTYCSRWYCYETRTAVCKTLLS